MIPFSNLPLPTDRNTLLRRLRDPSIYDIAVVGGGATGLGVALDAAARGLRVVLIDSHDFAKGTSSRSTKLVHGGVRYLAQGNIGLVREALRERSLILQNAPYLAQPLPFVVPSYHWWEAPFYGSGLLLYDVLAGSAGLGRTQLMGRARTLACLPGLQQAGLKGGVQYWDGQFNDARLALALARTAARYGALLVNYCTATDLCYQDDKISGLLCRDTLDGQEFRINSRCVVNATGVWVDALRQKDGAAMSTATGAPTPAMVAPSQGVHMVVERHFLGSDAALMVPKTSDGRVLFAVPWLGKVILGTTDTPRHDLAREPTAFDEEIEFILGESARYLSHPPQRADVKSIWVGLRPLVKPPQTDGSDTKALSREHTIVVSPSGLVTVTGGKWTTYRAMAEDVLDQCAQAQLLPATRSGITQALHLVGSGGSARTIVPIHRAPGWHSYGAEADYVRSMPGADDELCPGLTIAMVRFAVRHEYALRVEDVLARRFRLLFLDAAAAAGLAARVGEIMRQEGLQDPDVAGFETLAASYLIRS